MTQSELKPPSWHSAYILAPDYKLLRQSLNDFGWIYPIVARKEDGTIIDGLQRWRVAQEDKRLQPIPVTWIDCDEADAIVMHIRLNRARGSLYPYRLAKAMRRVLRSGKYEPEELRIMVGMTSDEFDTVMTESLIKKRKVSLHEYSRAWVPVETGGQTKSISIERPPTPDQ